MTTIINASPTNGLQMTSDGSGIAKLQSNGVTTNALAWVNFNGTTSPGTIRSQYNVSSVTKSGTGDYTLNFTNVLSDVNYCVTGTLRSSSQILILQNYLDASVNTAARILSFTAAGSGFDASYACIAIFGN